MLWKWQQNTWNPKTGGIISVTDANGTANTDPTHIANVNPIRYRGYYYDSEIGLYYLQSRYYDPAVKRFINADTLLGANKDILGNNVFAYCSNDPINYKDETGCGKILNKIKNRVTQFVEKAKKKAEKLRNNVIGAAEHKKKGTTNPANKGKHQKGMTRKNRDNHNERGMHAEKIVRTNDEGMMNSILI